MVRLYSVQLTNSSRPILVAGEIERSILNKVDLVFEGTGGLDAHISDEYRDGYVVLTNFRLIWMTTRPPELPFEGAPCALPLAAVAGVDSRPGRLIKHPRLKLAVRVDASAYPAVGARHVEAVRSLKLVCRGGSPDSWRQQLEAALARAAWTALPAGAWQELLGVPGAASASAAAGPGAALAALARPSPFSSSGAGSSGSAGPQRQQQPSAAAAPDVFRPDPIALQELLGMGFPTQHAVNALLASGNRDPGQAVEWLLGHEGSPLLDHPTPYSTGPAGDGSSLVAAAAAPSAPGSAVAAAMGSSGGSSVQRQMSLGSVGLSGVLKREEARAAATENSLDQAFQDLRQLMVKAQEMVSLAEYFRGRMASRRSGNAGAPGTAQGSAAGSGGGEEEELDAETALDLLNLGIVSPVTRESAGSLYHQELARQLADFLAGPVQRAGGMMPLPDVYCLFNRARGTELVSPDDLLAAARLLGGLPRAGLALREFASGVKVVQAASHSDERVCQALAALVQPVDAGQDGSREKGGSAAAAACAAAGAAGGPVLDGAAAEPGEELWRPSLGPAITQTEAAAALQVPLAVASEHLLMAEARGVLCRDDGGPEGLRFFRNFFLDPPDVFQRRALQQILPAH